MLEGEVEWKPTHYGGKLVVVYGSKNEEVVTPAPTEGAPLGNVFILVLGV